MGGCVAPGPLLQAQSPVVQKEREHDPLSILGGVGGVFLLGAVASGLFPDSTPGEEGPLLA